MNLYTVLDRKAHQVSVPFGAVNDGIACRMVMEWMKEPHPPMFAKYPKDFALVHIGEFADDDGTLTPAKDVREVVDVSVLYEAIQPKA